MLTFRKANINDTETILNLYRKIIKQIQNNKTNPEWKQNIYPLEEDIIKSIELDEVYVGQLDSEIVSSIVVNHETNPGYENIKWQIDTDDENVYYIHLVAVNQEHKNKGIAKKMLKYVFKEAKTNHIKSLRLSLNKNNIAIEKLYTQFDFKHIKSIKVNYEKRGLISFEVYEKLI